MSSLRLDHDQRFTCRQCGRCCRRGEVVVTRTERESLRAAGAERWFRERGDSAEGAQGDPFAPIPASPGHYRIRKRPDASCGFLSADARCRIHQELGGCQKPLTCRLFPFGFHPADGPTVVTTSFACPTVLANVGARLSEQEPVLRDLCTQWCKQLDDTAPGLTLAQGRSLSRHTLETLRQVLRRMLDRPGPDGGPDVRLALRRMAAFLEDLTRWRVLRLEDHAFAEYLTLTGRHAAEVAEPPPPRPASRQGLRLGRGLLFAALAVRVQRQDGRQSGLRLDLRLRLFALLGHLHGLVPPIAGFDARRARQAGVDLAIPEVRDLVHHYLRASIETLGTGRRPVLDELSFAVALLNVGVALASQLAVREGPWAVTAGELGEGLLEACDLAHVEPGGAFGGLIGSLSRGVEALRTLADGDGLWPRSRSGKTSPSP